MTTDDMTPTYMECPFCKEKDFDLPGLKYHFVMGYCEIYSGIDLVREWSHSVKKVAP